MESWCPSQEAVLRELEAASPGVPFLALGQTVFWDEPLKAAVLQASLRHGSTREFLAGVHDTDYFAKHPGKADGRTKGFQALPHNDTSTKALWSAAAEFSALFGSETVVTKEILQDAGAKVARVEKERPGWLDQITEAWGWRGLVSFNAGQKITAEKPLGPLFPTLYETFDWALNQSLALVSGPYRERNEEAAERLRSLVCDMAGDREGLKLGDFYEKLLPRMYEAVAGEALPIRSTRTTRLLAFNPGTASLPRFHLLDLFVNPATRPEAEAAYNRAVRSTEMYTLDRFGAGALPFDVVVPGRGRGTLRLGTRGGLIMTPLPLGFSFKKAPESAAELAEILERRFGHGVVLIGKAITLIGMLAAEHVFVFHEGASSYIHRSRRMHQLLAEAGHQLTLHPVLRVRHRVWDALEECCGWLKLPDPLHRPFGTEELCGPSFARRWREVAERQRGVMAKLAELRRPLALVQYLQEEVGGHWRCLASEYETLHALFDDLQAKISQVRWRKKEVLARIRQLRHSLDEAHKEMGRHWREHLFDREPEPTRLAEREAKRHALDRIQAEIKVAWDQWRGLQAEQDALIGSDQVKRAQQRRRDIALEAELMRMRLIREAVIASQGLERSGHRPAAWWLPLICPGGSWYRAASRMAEFRLEQLV